jgi:3-deoxy-D-manno-octulosonate 8-phosphate phosphatase (KDO 8-P phosphatase)
VTSVTEVEASFSTLGGVFLTPARELAIRAENARGVVFDWDGVFNGGSKGEGASSSFNEADSMGTNLLRYALWRARGEQPVAAIVTGEDNPTARRFATREHFHAVYSGVKNKAIAIDELCAAHSLDSRELICMFDDVNDLGMAEKCGVRVLVRRDSSPLLQEHVARHGLCDYITAARSHENAVREAAELLLGLLGVFEQVVASRVAWDADYARYFAARQALQTHFDTGARVQTC